ncbi:CinA family protein [Labedella phragmitis]|uniref:CinA family protein n=1 Tax=Labedella phragmitis TaxID=2498849 RepID=A0A444PT14_9MICO|nr:CinA family protein [Labedella phragmitis]RWZ51022.1 CinA family protein [Labedella phragmitis]
MTSSTDDTGSGATRDAVDRIAERAPAAGIRVAVAESLTSGAIASRLGAGSGASEWFSGGVVAYDAEVKFGVLGVERGPVVTASCAEQLARGVASLLGADAAIGATGVGGPGQEEGQPEGTAFIAVALRDRIEVREFHFDGDPAEVVSETTEAAVSLLAAMLEEGDDGS